MKYDITLEQLKKAGQIDVWLENPEKDLYTFRKHDGKWQLVTSFGKLIREPMTPTKVMNCVNESMRKFDFLGLSYTVELSVGVGVNSNTWYWIEGIKGKRSKLIHKD